MKRRGTGVVWPLGLAVCRPEDWRQPADDLLDGLGWFEAWNRWVEARYQHLLRLGYARDDAQFEAVGDFPPPARRPGGAP